MFTDVREVHALAVEKDFKSACYYKLNGFEPKYALVRGACGLFIGVGSFLATVIARIALVVEAIFKGLITIFWSRFDGHLFIGANMLFALTPIFTLFGVLSITRSAAAIFEKAYNFAFYNERGGPIQYVPPDSYKKNEGILKQNALNALPFFERLALKAQYEKRIYRF